MYAYLKLPLNLSWLCAAIVPHQAVALIGIEMALFGISVGYNAVHMGCGRQTFKVFTSFFYVERTKIHTIKVYYVEVDFAIWQLLK